MLWAIRHSISRLIMKKEMTLNEVCEKMGVLNNDGYETYFKGTGNGVRAIAEYWELKKEKEKNKKNC